MAGYGSPPTIVMATPLALVHLTFTYCLCSSAYYIVGLRVMDSFPSSVDV